MKKFLIIAVLAGAATSARAAVACSTLTTLSAIVTAGSCEVGDKIFSNFSYTPGSGDPTSAQVGVTPVENDPSALFGLQFSSLIQTAWISNFTLSFAVAVDQTACQALYAGTASCFISGVQDQFQAGVAGASNTATFTGVHSPGGTISLNALLVSNETGQITGLNTASMTNSYSGVASGTFPIAQFGMELFQGKNPTVPEPMTLSLMGVGLLGLGLMRRRMKQ
jgi:PEP-CTERM motif